VTAVANDIRDDGPGSGPGPVGAAGDDLPGGVQGEEVPKPPPANPFLLRSVGAWSGQLPAVSWVCKALHLTCGRPACLVGYAGSGKTVLLADLALAVSAPPGVGYHAWGGIPIDRRGRVAIFDLEVGEYLSRQRLQRLAHGNRALLQQWDERLFITCFPSMSLLDKDVEAQLAEQLEGFTLAIFDSLTMLLAGSDENSASVSKILGALARVSEKTGCAILVIHHEGKPPAEGQKEARFRGRGSSAIQGMWSSQWAVSSQDGVLSVEHGKSQWGKLQPTWTCQIADVGEVSEETGVAPGLRVERAVPAEEGGEEAISPSALQKAKRQVLDLLGALGAMSATDLLAKVKAGKDTKYKALEDLRLDGRIVRDKEGRKVTFHLPDDTSPDTSLDDGEVSSGHFPASGRRGGK